MHKEFITEGKTVNAEFYTGVMDRLLKLFQWVCPAAFCSQDFFLLHDNVPAHKAASLPVFDPKIYYNTLSPPMPPPQPPLLNRFIAARLLCFVLPKLKMKLKGLYFVDVAEIQEGIIDELKKVQKEEFSEAFQKLYNHAKACIYATGTYFE